MRVKSDGQSLTGAAFRRAGGKDSGAAHWWLRRDDGEFVSIPRVEGRRVFDEQMELEPGAHVLGTGRGSDAIRVKIEVAAPKKVEGGPSALSKVAADNRKAAEKLESVVRRRAEPRGRTARAVAGLPPLVRKSKAERPLSRRSTLGTLCTRLK